MFKSGYDGARTGCRKIKDFQMWVYKSFSISSLNDKRARFVCFTYLEISRFCTLEISRRCTIEISRKSRRKQAKIQEMCSLNDTSDLFVTSKNTKHEFSKSPIHEFKMLLPEILLKALVNGVLFHVCYFKKYFKPCLFILKALKDILQHFKFVNWRIRVFVFWCHE